MADTEADLEHIILNPFFNPHQMTWRACHIHGIIQAQTTEKKAANIILQIQSVNFNYADYNCQMAFYSN